MSQKTNVYKKRCDSQCSFPMPSWAEFRLPRPIFTNFSMHVTRGRIAPSCSGGVVLSYVLPVLWVTPYYGDMLTTDFRSRFVV